MKKRKKPVKDTSAITDLYQRVTELERKAKLADDYRTVLARVEARREALKAAEKNLQRAYEALLAPYRQQTITWTYPNTTGTDSGYSLGEP